MASDRLPVNSLNNEKKSSFDAIAVVRENAVAFGVGTGIVLLAVLIVGAYEFQRRQGDVNASRMLLHAKSQTQQEAILNQYPSSAAAPAALLALASGAFHAGAYDQALDHYNRFLEKHADHPMALTAVLGVSMCQEGRGQTALALDGFSKFVADNPGHFLEPQALFGKARCLHALGRDVEARGVYESYISANPSDAWTPVAESALSSLDMESRAKSSTAR